MINPAQQRRDQLTAVQPALDDIFQANSRIAQVSIIEIDANVDADAEDCAPQPAAFPDRFRQHAAHF